MKTEPIILLPGLLCDASVWKVQQSELEKYAPLIIPDLSKAGSPEAMVNAALANAPATFALAGHSMGGWVALEIMRHHANRVTRLCLLNTTAEPDSKQKSAARQAMIQLAQHGKINAVIEQLAPAFIYNQTYLHTIATMMKRNQHAFISQQTAMLARDTCVPILRNIQCPTTIIHANQDNIFHLNDAEALHRGINDSHLYRIDRSGHMSPIEAGKEVVGIMCQWLTE